MRRYVSSLPLVALAILATGCGEIEMEKKSTWELNSSLAANNGNTTKIFDIALDSTRNRVYVHGIITEQVAEIDTDSGELVGYINTGLGGYHLSYMDANPSTSRLYIADQKSQTLIKIDADNNHISETSVTLPSTPTRIVVRKGKSGKGYVIVSFSGKNKVLIYDVNDLSLEKTLDLDAGMYGPMGMTIQNDTLYVALGRGVPETGVGNESGIAVVDLNSLSVTDLFTFSGARGAEEISRDPDNGNMYLCSSTRFWAVNSAGTLLKTFKSEGPEFKEVAAYDGFALLLTRDGATSSDGAPYGSVVLYDPEDWTEHRSYTVGMKPSRMVLDREEGKLYTANMAESTVSIVDLDCKLVTAVTLLKIAGKKVVSPVQRVTEEKVGNAIESVLLSPDGSKLYVNSRLGNSNVYRYCTSSGTRKTLDVGDWPTGMAVDKGANELYVVNHFNSTVSIIDINTDETVETVALGIETNSTHDLSGVAYDDVRNKLYCVFPEQGKMVVLATGKREVIATVDVATPSIETEDGNHVGKLQVAADPVRNEVWLYNRDEKTLEVLDPTQNYICLKEISLSSKSFFGYASDILFLAAGLGKIFVGPYVFDLESRGYEDLIGAGQVVRAYDSDLDYLVSATADESAQTVSLHLLKSSNYDTRGTRDLTTYSFCAPDIAVDVDSLKVYVGQMAEATVDKWTYSLD